MVRKLNKMKFLKWIRIITCLLLVLSVINLHGEVFDKKPLPVKENKKKAKFEWGAGFFPFRLNQYRGSDPRWSS